MSKHIKRCLSFLLVLVLVMGMLPTAYASEVTEPSTPETIPEETTESVPETSPATEPAETASPETEPNPEETEAAVESTEETEPTELVLSSTFTSSNAAMLASTQSGIMLFDFTDNGDYTTRLNSQLTIKYKPNRTGSTKTAYIKNLGWHFARYGGVPYADDPIYCIEPYRDFAVSTSGNSVDRDVTVDGSGSSTGSNVWYALPEARREAIGLILLYSNQRWNDSYSVFDYKKDANPNVPLRIATQFLIYEIVCGLRDADDFTLKSTNESGTAGDIFYDAGVAAVSGFAPHYNAIVASVQSALKIPSFTGSTRSNAPTISLTGEETSVYDSNEVLGNFSFTDGNGASFDKSGNTLYITQTGTISDSTVFTAKRSVPSAYNSSYSIWYMSGSTYQTCINLYSSSTGTLNGYFKLDAPDTGTLSLTKITEDGKNLSGWKFNIYSDSACTSLVSGPHTTDSNGKISVENLSAGTYYVKEIGHTNTTVEAQYVCTSTNPQKVTVESGETATVNFRNDLATSSVKIIKTTNTGGNLAGWQINLYTDAECTSLVDGSPFVTGTDGTITVSDLKPGTYYAVEIASEDPYWECDSEVKSVKVTANETASITFSNTHYGCIQIQKTTNTGNDLGGWVFRVMDPDGNTLGDFTTDDEGVILLENLLPGRYTVYELPVEDDYWATEFGWHDVIVKAGDIVTDTWLNKDQGLGWFYKQTNTGDNLEGWEITIYSDAECTEEVRTLTTNKDGKVGYYMDPGIYYAKETGDTLNRFDSEFWLIDDEVKQFEIKCHEDTAVYFSNSYYGSLKIVKTMEDGSDAAGWQFKIIDANGAEIEGSPFTTDAEGIILTGAIAPGEYVVEEILPEDSAYYCVTENPKTVTIVQGETAEVSFTNALRPGKISLEKVDNKGQPLAGATFLLEYSEDGSLWWPIEYSDSEDPVVGGCSNPNVVDGCLTSGSDGMIEWDNLLPDLYYRVKETKAPDGYNLLKKFAYNDQLTTEDLHITIRVINTRTFNLPETGSSSLLLMPVLGMVCMALAAAVVCSRKRRV